MDVDHHEEESCDRGRRRGPAGVARWGTGRGAWQARGVEGRTPRRARGRCRQSDRRCPRPDARPRRADRHHRQQVGRRRRAGRTCHPERVVGRLDRPGLHVQPDPFRRRPAGVGARCHRPGRHRGPHRHRCRSRARSGRARQGPRRSGPLLREPERRHPVPRRLRPRHPHGRDHRRCGRGPRPPATVGRQVRRGRTRGTAVEHEGRCRRRRHRRLAGHRRPRLGGRAPQRRGHERAGGEPVLRHRVAASVAGGPAGACGRERLEPRHLRRRVGRQRRTAVAHPPHAGSRPAHHGGRRRRPRRFGEHAGRRGGRLHQRRKRRVVAPTCWRPASPSSRSASRARTSTSRTPKAGWPETPQVASSAGVVPPRRPPWSQARPHCSSRRTRT